MSLANTSAVSNRILSGAGATPVEERSTLLEKVYLSDAGPKVSPAIYGFYRWMTESTTTAEAMEKTVNLCLEVGINTFDHADIYGAYQCEALFGKALQRRSFRREDVILFTKCGLRVPGPGAPDVKRPHYNTSAGHIVKSVDNSLRRLQTEYLDIFLLNYLDHVSNLEETALTLLHLKETGKIRSIGVCNFSVFQHQLLASYLKLPIVTNHIELNLLNTEAIKNGQIDYIKQRYMRPLASSPLAAGRIAYGRDRLALRIRRKLQALQEKYGADIESIAVAWLVKLGALPLIGTTNEQRIRNIVNAFEIELDIEDWYDLYSVTQNLPVNPLPNAAGEYL